VSAEAITIGPPAWYTTTTRVLRLARANWRFVLTLATLGAGVSTVTALLLPSRYRARAAFQAESPPSQPSLSNLGLAGVLGSQLSGLQQLGPQNTALLLADLVTTDAVLRRVVNATYPWQGPSGERSATLAAIYGFGDKRPALRDFLAVNKLRRAVSVQTGIRTGIVRFAVEQRTPELALAVAETTLAALNEANIELRQQRAAAERAFTAQRTADARLTLAATESTLAVFYVRNRNLLTSPTLQMEESALRRDADMARQVFVQLQLQEAQAGLQALRNTPTISVLDPPTLPVRRSWPKRRLALVGGFLIGLALAFVRLTWRDQVASWRG